MNFIKDHIKDNLVPSQTYFNTNGFVRWRTFVYSNLFHWPTGKYSGNGVCRYVPALISTVVNESLLNLGRDTKINIKGK